MVAKKKHWPDVIKTSEYYFLLSRFCCLISYTKYLMIKIRKLNWSLKTLLHGHKRIARSGLWAPDFTGCEVAGPLYLDAGSVVVAFAVVGSVVGFFVTGVAVVDKASGTALQVDGLEYLLDFVSSYRSAPETRSPIPWLHVFAKVAIS